MVKEIRQMQDIQLSLFTKRYGIEMISIYTMDDIHLLTYPWPIYDELMGIPIILDGNMQMINELFKVSYILEQKNSDILTNHSTDSDVSSTNSVNSVGSAVTISREIKNAIIPKYKRVLDQLNIITGGKHSSLKKSSRSLSRSYDDINLLHGSEDTKKHTAIHIDWSDLIDIITKYTADLSSHTQKFMDVYCTEFKFVVTNIFDREDYNRKIGLLSNAVFMYSRLTTYRYEPLTELITVETLIHELKKSYAFKINNISTSVVAPQVSKLSMFFNMEILKSCINHIGADECICDIDISDTYCTLIFTAPAIFLPQKTTTLINADLLCNYMAKLYGGEYSNGRLKIVIPVIHHIFDEFDSFNRSRMTAKQTSLKQLNVLLVCDGIYVKKYIINLLSAQVANIRALSYNLFIGIDDKKWSNKATIIPRSTYVTIKQPTNIIFVVNDHWQLIYDQREYIRRRWGKKTRYTYININSDNNTAHNSVFSDYFIDGLLDAPILYEKFVDNLLRSYVRSPKKGFLDTPSPILRAREKKNADKNVDVKVIIVADIDISFTVEFSTFIKKNFTLSIPVITTTRSDECWELIETHRGNVCLFLDARMETTNDENNSSLYRRIISAQYDTAIIMIVDTLSINDALSYIGIHNILLKPSTKDEIKDMFVKLGVPHQDVQER
jgi:hypothetical protein